MDETPAPPGHNRPVESDLDSIFLELKEEVPLPRKKVPSGDVYEAARAGDVDRLRFWLDQGVNVNARDAWDSVALYYACLAGHLDAALLLLENGAICSEHTFDGDRCHYAALNLRIRKLLKAFESRPPPLEPLARALRQVFVSSNGSHGNGGSGVESATASAATAPDVVFFVAGTAIGVHRAILAARSPFFHHKFANEWRDRPEIRFAGRKLKCSAFLSLIHFFYSDRLDVAVEDMEDLVRICKVCRCRSLKLQLEKELVHQKFADYKSVNGVDESQRRYILQGSALPEPDRLPAAMRNLFTLSLANSTTVESKVWRGRATDDHGARETSRPSSSQRETSACIEQGSHVGDDGCDSLEFLRKWEETLPGAREAYRLQAGEGAVTGCTEDHADVCFQVDGKLFRSHKFILAARSEYFEARFARANDFQRGSGCLTGDWKGVMPVLEEHDIDASSFQMLLEYVYTGTLENVDCDQAEKMFDAASRYLMFSLKRAVADALVPQLETASRAELCNWLLLADMYGVWKLREHCLSVMALNLELFAMTREFRQMVASLPPPSGDSSLRTTAPSAPGEGGQDKQDNILDDLREKWLAIEGEELDKRDASALEFDRMLEQLVIQAGIDASDVT